MVFLVQALNMWTRKLGDLHIISVPWQYDRLLTSCPTYHSSWGIMKHKNKRMGRHLEKLYILDEMPDLKLKVIWWVWLLVVGQAIPAPEHMFNRYRLINMLT